MENNLTPEEEKGAKLLLYISGVGAVMMIGYLTIVMIALKEVPANEYLHVRKTCYKTTVDDIIICSIKPNGESGQIEYCPVSKDDL